MNTILIIISLIIICLCIYFILDAFWAYDKLLIFGIGGSTIIIYILLHIFIPKEAPPGYASDFLGASFPVELIICMLPSIIILGIAGFISNIKWKIKEKRKG